MGKALTVQEIQIRIDEKTPNRFRVDDTFKSEKRIKVKVFCFKHKKPFSQDLSNFLHENDACPDCGKERKREKEKPGKIKKFQEKINSNKQYEGLYFIRDIIYNDDEERTYAHVECIKHGLLEENIFRTKDLHRRKPCKVCQEFRSPRKTDEEIISEIKEKIQNFENFPIHKIERGKGRIFIFFSCKTHINQGIKPKQFDIIQSKTNTIPCDKCRSLFLKKLKIKHTGEEFIKLGKEIHPEYLYNLTDINNAILENFKEIPVICPEHGVFFTSYDQHIYSKGGFCKECKNSSYYEKKIVEIISQKYKLDLVNNIAVFPKLKHKKKLRPDIYIESLKLLIEYDGLYHFKPKPPHYDLNKFLEAVKRDEIKNRFARKETKNLLRIPYTKRNKIENILSECISKIQSGKSFYKIHYMPFIVFKRIKMIKIRKEKYGVLKKYYSKIKENRIFYQIWIKRHINKKNKLTRFGTQLF
ncbi:hypothetical protein DBR39_00950 [Chryseobacterium sp. KBW03]|uniref:hypothetical protein n=1 Tax=Chryseobacterium sp. KBW03 TaxID=2153362 RepID=UPI000F5B17CA|nr:hypothetical protein [Chryseobacterium sp. KBW03]RQO42475.1 hypothetical protein DBR39_00950 [Chryseobacterium sp. KBW03]